ncbi:dihydrolipoamide acetyltransferase family protein [Aromatoleum petrolei]|uniref:Dihydrolipoamide acetyltransferase component of pyruvate dehydrogenase complex n=1 Tax=Aromatoleum petrolei TaxID=76116 RepID=A0ABX1MIW5_9RHOO|nr:dihydrolipoamide acetyltransferase family protein [Aromatoleum petrolei]NMF87693.1 2-oxo acid dehydrogenase subunit E2 [Aromatoleum petrolei]QTQ38179.1 Dihydrolipoamide acetyltransferase component of pyruvate dehydrogenase complex [Aromatoleum petrolei]
MFDFTLPSLGADMDEGKLIEWKVKPGDTVHKGQVVAIVDTSKAAVDVEIWQDGVVHELLVEAGERIPVGTALATLLEPGEKAPPKGAPSKGARAGGKEARRAAGGAAAVGEGRPLAAAAAVHAEGARLRISPAARKRADALGVDIARLTGSGPGGAVTLADVEAAAQPGAPKAVEAIPAAHPEADRNAEMRRAIAAAMSRSKREIPHYYLVETIPMARAQRWLAQANEGRPITARLLMAVLQLKAVAAALAQYPDLNGIFRDGCFEPVQAAHIGVAISLRQGGLIAPALHDVGSKPLDQLMRELADLVKRTRAGSLRSSEMSDPTITVTNLGDQGVEAVMGVIYPPQVALVGFGRIMERPWVEDGALLALPTVVASLAADHRVSDGHRGALFLAELRERLQRPEEL